MQQFENKAREAEKRGDWAQAESLWRACGKTEEADACKTLVDAIEKGDEFRELVRKRCNEAGITDRTSNNQEYMDIQHAAHEEIYREQ